MCLHYTVFYYWIYRRNFFYLFFFKLFEYHTNFDIIKLFDLIFIFIIFKIDRISENLAILFKNCFKKSSNFKKMNLFINYPIFIAIFKIEYYKNNRAIHKKITSVSLYQSWKKLKTTIPSFQISVKNFVYILTYLHVSSLFITM